jgi:VanZ family protein
MPSAFTKILSPDVSEPQNSGWHQVSIWLPPVIAVSVIAIESTGTFSAEHTGSWLRPVLEHLFGRFTDPRWERVHHAIRKTGHFIGYGLLCLTFLRAWILTLGRKVDLPHIRRWAIGCLLAVMSAAIVASLDEWHQTYLPSRTGRVADVGLDSLGATTACILAILAASIVIRGRKVAD